MHCLEVLLLPHTGISDRGLTHVRNLTNLKVVYISGNGNAHERLTHFSEQTTLERVMLSSRGIITDAGLAQLRRLRRK
jgi:hypothetical protein